MYLTAPSSYMSAADPRSSARRRWSVADRSTGRSYTPQDYPQLFEDAGLAWAEAVADCYIGFVEFADPRQFPNVDVYAEKGSGIDTWSDIGLHDLSVGQLLDGQTDVLHPRRRHQPGGHHQRRQSSVWESMRCFRFALTDNPGVDHFSLPTDEAVMARLIADAARPRTKCRCRSRRLS